MNLSTVTISELEYRRDCIGPDDMGVSQDEWAESGWPAVFDEVNRVLASPTIATLSECQLAREELIDVLSTDAMRTNSGKPTADAKKIEADLLRSSTHSDDRYDPDSVCTHSRRTVVVDGVRYYSIA
jgi:hypothetical protein